MRILYLLLATLAYGQSAPERIPWNESPEALAGHFVSVTLKDGSRVGGYWTSVTPNTFTMRVEQTSNRRAFAKGIRKMPRESIAEVRAGERRVRGRVIGTIAGLYLLTIAVVEGNAKPGFVAAAPWVGGIGGYYVGRAIDQSTRPIVLTPQPQP